MLWSERDSQRWKMDKEQRLRREREFQDNRTLNKEDKRLIIHSEALWGSFSEKLAGFKDNQILALGCGTGNYEFRLAKDRNMVTSIDISPESIKVLEDNIRKKDEGEHVKALIMDAEDLKFEDDSFDAVYGIAVLHHLDLEKVMPELRRVVRKGGKLLFVEPPRSNFIVRRYRARTPHMRSRFEHPLTRKDFKTIREYFPRIRVSGYCLLQTLMPKSIRHNPCHDGLRRMLEYSDSFILAVFPFLKFYCYSVIIELER